MTSLPTESNNTCDESFSLAMSKSLTSALDLVDKYLDNCDADRCVSTTPLVMQYEDLTKNNLLVDRCFSTTPSARKNEGNVGNLKEKELFGNITPCVSTLDTTSFMSSPNRVNRLFDGCETESEYVNSFDELSVEPSLRVLGHRGSYIPAPAVQTTKPTRNLRHCRSYLPAPAVQTKLNSATKPLPRRVVIRRGLIRLWVHWWVIIDHNLFVLLLPMYLSVTLFNSIRNGH